jgi:hypothetical protein
LEKFLLGTRQRKDFVIFGRELLPERWFFNFDFVLETSRIMLLVIKISKCSQWPRHLLFSIASIFKKEYIVL